MKKSIIAFVFLILIVGTWFVSRIWYIEPVQDSNSAMAQESGTEPEPDADNNGNLSAEELALQREAERLEAEQREADRLEAERLEAERLEAELILRREAVLEESKLLSRGYFYDEAIALLRADEKLINQETQSLKAKITAEKNDLVRFDGEIKHIFFHSLILYPQELFTDLSVPTGGYNEGFVFQSELLKILPQLFERGYVLYNINDIFSKDSDGNMQQNDVYLPSGKIPLVLSIDDPSYHYNKTASNRVGFADRVVLDENGELATEVPTPEGETVVTYDGDVHIIIDAFVKEHPEFSFRGSKGIIAATGFMGVFGYDIDDLQSEKYRQTVIDICGKFKENGWLFANHSYTHNRVGFWGPETNTENIRYDVGRWREVIEPIVGETNIFIAPFGYLLRGEQMQVILDNGYNIYCTVDFNQPINIYPTHVVMGRIEIGGFSFARHANILNRDFFDVASVIDSHRPPVSSS